MATTYSQLKYGSSGSDVKTLQTYLNQVGNYGLTVDGQFGAKTQAAVKDYQKSNNLTVDGIVGNLTWGKLSSAVSGSTTNTGTKNNTGTTTNAGTTTNTSTATNTGTTTNTVAASTLGTYNPDADTAYQQALAALQQAAASIPTYKGSYDEQLQEVYDKIVNREKFTYDLNSDALYQQYADQYQLMGQQAMMDTMGQAASLTGGYGNSYASTAGNQAYQAYLQQLNGVVPELYGMALDQYNAEGDKLLTQYSMLGDMADDEYGKYQDSLNQYWQNVSYLKDNADSAYEKGYNQWLAAYQQERDKIADQQWQAQYDESVRQWEAELAEQQRQFDKQYNLSVSKSSGSSGSSGGSGGSGGSGNTAKSQIAQLQSVLGVTPDGIWGPKSQAAAKNMYGVTSFADAWAKYTNGGTPPVGNNASLTGFTGTTYSEAVAYAQSKGVSGARASSILTKSEWSRAKSGGGTRDGADQFDTYAEYLQYAVDSMIASAAGSAMSSAASAAANAAKK